MSWIPLALSNYLSEENFSNVELKLRLLNKDTHF